MTTGALQTSPGWWVGQLSRDDVFPLLHMTRVSRPRISRMVMSAWRHFQRIKSVSTNHSPALPLASLLPWGPGSAQPPTWTALGELLPANSGADPVNRALFCRSVTPASPQAPKEHTRRLGTLPLTGVSAGRVLERNAIMKQGFLHLTQENNLLMESKSALC